MRRLDTARRLALVACALAALAPHGRTQATAPTVGFGAVDAALATCRDCHDGAGSKGRFDLAALPGRGFGADWLHGVARIRERVRTGEMPPPDAEPLAADARAALLQWCDATLADGTSRLPWTPGRVTVRRLARGQWQASAQALLGVTTPERQALLPDLPALSEAIPGFGLSNWNGLFLPGRTPVAIAERLFVEANKAILSPELKRRQAVAGIEPVGSRSRAEFAQFVRDDTARWARIVKQSGIVVE